jgi:glutathione S-transferase
MRTLYHCVSARSFRPLWTLEELRLPYRLVMMPFPPRVRARDYLAVNPLGTVPAFVDDATRMTESVAICEYLAARYDPGGLAVMPDEPEFGSYLNWLHFGEATLTFPQTLVLRYGRFEPPERRLPQAVEDYTRWFLARLRGIEAAVSARPYLCANRLTAADISVGYALMLAAYLDLEPNFPDSVRSYWAMLQTLPSYARALAAQEQAAMDQNVPTVPAPLTS